MEGNHLLTTCKGCGKSVPDPLDLSYRGLCPDCSKGRSQAAIEAMTTCSGPLFDKWRRSMAACVGAKLEA